MSSGYVKKRAGAKPARSSETGPTVTDYDKGGLIPSPFTVEYKPTLGERIVTAEGAAEFFREYLESLDDDG